MQGDAWAGLQIKLLEEPSFLNSGYDQVLSLGLRKYGSSLIAAQKTVERLDSICSHLGHHRISNPDTVQPLRCQSILVTADLTKRPVEGFSAGLVDDSSLFEWAVTIMGPPDTL